MEKKFLVLIPTNRDKSYTLGKFIENLRKLESSSKFDILFSDDGLDEDYRNIIKSLGYEVIPVQKTIDAIKNGEKVNIVQCLANTREALRNEFIKRKKYTHAIWFDSDVIMPDYTIQMFTHDLDENPKLDIVSGVYWQQKSKIENGRNVSYLYPVVFKYLENECYDLSIHKYGAEMNVQELFPGRLIGGPNDDIRIIAIGTGIFMASRKLMEDDNWHFRFNPNKPDTTEDMWFCLDIRELGYEIYLDSRICCRHNFQSWRNKIKDKQNY